MELPEVEKTKKGAATPSDSSLEGFFDVAPDSRIVRSSGTVSATASTRAKASRTPKGVYSHDPILGRNPNELWRFLASNLSPPRLLASLTGTHKETKTRYRMHNSKEVQYTVVDFAMHIDISNHVGQWSLISAHAPHCSPMTDHSSPITIARKDLGTPSRPTVRDVLGEYCSSRNPFKEFRMRKLVAWDYDRVTELLKEIVLSTGYSGTVEVKYLLEDYVVVALASNECSICAHSPVVRGLCFLSCLCFVCWPAWAMARKRMRNRLTCEYRCSQSADEFFTRNRAMIRSAVSQREKHKTIVAL